MDAALPIPVHYWWLAAGAIFCVLEILGVSGIGFLFAGLAALCVGIAVTGHWILPESYLIQAAWFFALTLFWAALLWKKLRPKKGITYQDTVGARGTVVKGALVKGKMGSVQWSGTIMNAELTGAVDSLPEGSNVVIQSVRGNVLVVTPE